MVPDEGDSHYDEETVNIILFTVFIDAGHQLTVGIIAPLNGNFPKKNEF